MAEIELTQGKVALVDDADYGWLSEWKWRVKKSDNTCYAQTGNGVLMHRVILQAPRGMCGDHINGNGLDNRRSNLRLCTNKQNVRNQHKTFGTSEYKGVYWDKDRCKWKSQIMCDTVKINLGRYIDETDAAIAYDIASLRLFGEYAKTNIIKRIEEVRDDYNLVMDKVCNTLDSKSHIFNMV